MVDNDDMGRKKPTRNIELVRAPASGALGVFAVTERKKTKLYAFREIPCYIGGRGFAVHQVDRGGVYHVRIGEPDECSCECLGFLRHSHCRHIKGLLMMQQEGWLDNSTPVFAEKLDQTTETSCGS